MMDKIMKKCSWCNTDSALLVLRIGVGIIFLITGYMKASDMTGTVGFFTSLGFNAFWAYLVTAVELLGGATVLLGIYTRIGAKLLAIVMIVAIYVLRHDITMALAPISLLFSTLALMLAGGGKYAIKEFEK